MPSVTELIERLETDPFREENPFSGDLAECAAALFKGDNDEQRAATLTKWLSQHQPCLFGKITARLAGLAFCFLTENDLALSDEKIREKIQAARRTWRAKAYGGDASGFVILALSDRVARAMPNDAVKSLARKLCHLYLGRDETDEILLEDIFLRVPGKQDALIHWKAGVNYFCAQGDGRWWRDHRIPGGMAFSVNSVGHLVKSFQVGRSFEESWKALKLSEQEDWADFKIKSLGDALSVAMQTIDRAFDTEWGKATYLLPADRPHANPAHLDCPVQLPAVMQDKDFCEYAGFYHTDVTIPSEYFRPAPERPADACPLMLDFTYLFHNSIENPAYFEMGEGIQVKGEAEGNGPNKAQRMFGEEGVIGDYPELQAAVKEYSLRQAKTEH